MTKAIPKVSHLWRQRGAGFWCRVDEVKGTRALLRSPTGRANWVSFDTLWSKWEPASGAAVASMSTTPPAQPSALERVGEALKTLSVTGRKRNRPDLVDAAADAMAALTSLVSEARAEEREACARVADLVNGVSTSDRRRVSDAIRALR